MDRIRPFLRSKTAIALELLLVFLTCTAYSCSDDTNVLVSREESDQILNHAAQLVERELNEVSILFSAGAPVAWARPELARKFSSLPPDNDLVLVAGGDNDVNSGLILDTAELFVPSSGSFICVGGESGGNCNASMTDARENGSANLLATGEVLFAAGQDNSGSVGALSTAELFNPSSAAFSCVGGVSSSPPLCNQSMSDIRRSHTGTLLDPAVVSGPEAGMVLIAGGDDLSNPVLGTPLNTAELYNPATGKFICVGGVSTTPPLCNPSMTMPREDHAAALMIAGPLRGQVLIVGGDNSSGYLNAAELYDPATGAFTATGGMNEERVLPSATALSNGMVLVAGGTNGEGNPSGSAELYDPSTQTFSCVGGGGAFSGCNDSMVDSRRFFTATLLTNGDVFLAGGFDNSGNWVASTELFDPTTGTFSFAGNMTTPRGDHSATLIAAGPDAGQVLLTGGNDNSGNILSSAELYNPTTGTFTATGSMNAPRRDHYAVLVESASATSTPTATATETPTATATPTATPTSTTAAELFFAPKVVNFPAQVVLGSQGNTSGPKILKLFNPKNRKQNVSIIIESITSDDPEFKPSDGCVGTLATGASCPVSITFTPDAAGKRTGHLNVTSNAANPSISATLSGSGTLGVLTIKPKSVNFGSSAVDTPVTRPLTLVNNNPVPMSIGAISSSNPQFTWSGCANSQIAAKGTCPVTLTFTPAGKGRQAGALTIDNDGKANLEVRLIGIGVEAR